MEGVPPGQAADDGAPPAGADSPHLDASEQRQVAAERAFGAHVRDPGADLFAVFTGHAGVGAHLGQSLSPTLRGDTIGGVALVAMLNHAPLAAELHGEE